MRTIKEIKEAMTTDFMGSEDVAKAYGFNKGDAFGNHFGSVSIESLLFYIVACAIWILEKMFAQHSEEVDARIDETLPHRPKWYRDMVLNFMKDKALVTDTDRYDTTGMTEEEIAEKKVVKYAAATESWEDSLLTIKVAGEANGSRQPLDSETELQLKTYIEEIKDAGVKIALINEAADLFSCRIDIYYDTQMDGDTVEEACEAAINAYIENLPFNGEYTNMACVDALQTVDGVKIVEMKGSSVVTTREGNVVNIDARYIPESGYLKASNIEITMKPYYERI